MYYKTWNATPVMLVEPPSGCAKQCWTDVVRRQSGDRLCEPLTLCKYDSRDGDLYSLQVD